MQRFFLYGINAETARPAIACEDNSAPLIASHKTQSALSISHRAGAGTDVALHATVVTDVPVPRRMATLIHCREKWTVAFFAALTVPLSQSVMPCGVATPRISPCMLMESGHI
jgi:hypothetical protein